MAHRLGFAVKALGPGAPAPTDARATRSGPRLAASLRRLEATLDYLERRDVRMYRMPPTLVPSDDDADPSAFEAEIEATGDLLRKLGERAMSAGVRLSLQPGRFVVLNSERGELRRRAAHRLELLAAVLDAMHLGSEAVVVVEVGSAGGGIPAALDRFVAGCELLSERARGRLCIKNSDRRFGLGDVLGLARRTGSRVVWDALHHLCHNPDEIPEREALRLALDTWGGTVAKINYASPRTALDERRRRVGRRVERRLVLPPLRIHADMIDPIAFEHFMVGPAAGLDFDVMLEAKARDLALLRLREQLIDRGFAWSGGRLETAERAVPR